MDVDGDYYESLCNLRSLERRRVCKLLEGTFKAEKDTQAGVISSLCVAIEEAMFQGNGKDAKSKQYKAKFRTLKFNLSKNAELRQGNYVSLSL